MKPLISVIVPVYNAEKTLQRCVESILTQTCGQIEIILVDDGSRDGSGALCTGYAEENENIIAILQENGGVSAARNRGLAAAHGEYIGFVDSDDWIEPEMYEGLLAALQGDGCGISACGYRIHRYDGAVFNEMVDSATPARLELNQALRSLIHPRGIQGFLCNKLFARSLLTRAGGGELLTLDMRIHVCEDLLYVSKCIEAAGHIAYDSRPMYVYCVRDYGGGENYNRERRASELIALDQLVESWSGLSSELAHAIKQKYTSDAYHILRAAADAGDDEYIPVLQGHLRRYLKEYLRTDAVGLARKLRVVLALMLPNLENRVKAAVRK